MNRPLFPLFLRLDGRRCLVVGGGPVAWAKAASLLECGAKVTMVAPEFAPAPSLPAGASLTRVERGFLPADTDGMALVIAASDQRAVQEEARRAATERGIWVNVVDVPELCDFTFGARLARGPLQIVVSTEGAFPLLAQRLRDRLEARIDPRAGHAVELLGRIRMDYHAASSLPYAEKRAALAELLDDEMLTALEAGDLDAVRARIEDWRRASLNGGEPCSSSPSR